MTIEISRPPNYFEEALSLETGQNITLKSVQKIPKTGKIIIVE